MCNFCENSSLKPYAKALCGEMAKACTMTKTLECQRRGAHLLAKCVRGGQRLDTETMEYQHRNSIVRVKLDVSATMLYPETWP